MTVKFIDLFAGIGGFHLALHSLGAECVFASEWNHDARKTYEENFGSISPNLFEYGRFAGDITKVDKTEIPDFDLLTAGFPCQPFSQAGLKKGFDDIRGTLFFEIAEILRIKRPGAFFLENVRHLHKHDNGRTFETLKTILTKELGYSFQEFVVRASDYGLPQHRPRLFMIGFSDAHRTIARPQNLPITMTMSDVFGGECSREIGYTLRVGGRGSGVYDRRNWDAYLVDGRERRLTPDQAKLMQGFPHDFKFPVSEAQAMKQLGNSVAVDAIRAFSREIIRALGPI